MAIGTATLSLTIQGLNLEPAASPATVQQTPPEVIFQAANNLQYGTITVAQTSITNFFNALDPGCPFLYVRNATSGGSNMLVLYITPAAGIPTAINIGPGGVFAYGNLANALLGVSPASMLQQAGYGSFQTSSVIMEYLWAS